MIPFVELVVHHSASPRRVTPAEISRWHTDPRPLLDKRRLPTGFFVYRGRSDWTLSTLPKEVLPVSRRGNGWSDVGYHYLIDGHAKLHQGRPIHLVGAHAPPNTGRLGVCVIGDNTKERSAWTQEQWVVLEEFIDASLLLFPTIRWVGGHRDTGRATECPGLDLRSVLPGLPG